MSARRERPETMRETKRYADLPDDLHLTLVKEYGRPGDVFRPDILVESLYENDAGSGAGYVVTVSGPMLTKAGKDHATNRGSREFGGWRGSLEDIPAAIYPFLVGAEALSAPLTQPAT